MGRPRKIFASQTTANASTPENETVSEIRQPIKQMTGHANEEEMAASLPTNTMENVPDEEVRPRRKRRTKAEMQAARAAESIDDPLMADPQYREALAEMQAFGGAGAVKGCFEIAGTAMSDERIPLNKKEEKRLDGYFYVMSKKYNVLDPTNHWFTMALYFFGMLGSFVFARVVAYKGEAITEQIARFFGKEKEELETKEPVN